MDDSGTNDHEGAFAAWFTSAMRDRQLSQAELARRIGVDDAQVSRWRRGLVVPSVGHLQRIADVLGVPRAALDRLAGYPVADDLPTMPAAPEDRAPVLVAEPDPAISIEVDAYAAWFGRLLERRLPPMLWRAYASACAALADSLAASFADAHASVLAGDRRLLERSAMSVPAASSGDRQAGATE